MVPGYTVPTRGDNITRHTSQTGREKLSCGTVTVNGRIAGIGFGNDQRAPGSGDRNSSRIKNNPRLGTDRSPSLTCPANMIPVEGDDRCRFFLMRRKIA
jgi:hypothetical protein